MEPTWTDIATFAVLAAAAWIAFLQASEARRLRLGRFRPFVVLDVEHEYETGNYFLVLRNYGVTLARDIQISVTPPLESGLHEELGPDQVEKLRAWGRSVKTLAPGVERRALFDHITRRDGLPDHFEARIRYWDHELERSFEETVDLDLATVQGLGRLDQVRKTLDDVHAQLNRIATALERQLRAGPGG